MLQFKQGDTVLINNDVYIIANSDRFTPTHILFSIMDKVINIRYYKIILIEKIHKQKTYSRYTIFCIKTNIGECFCIAANKLKI